MDSDSPYEREHESEYTAIEDSATAKATTYPAKTSPLPVETHTSSRQWRSLHTPDVARRIECGGAYILHSRFAISYATYVGAWVGLVPAGWRRCLCEALVVLCEFFCLLKLAEFGVAVG